MCAYVVAQIPPQHAVMFANFIALFWNTYAYFFLCCMRVCVCMERERERGREREREKRGGGGEGSRSLKPPCLRLSFASVWPLYSILILCHMHWYPDTRQRVCVRPLWRPAKHVLRSSSLFFAFCCLHYDGSYDLRGACAIHIQVFIVAGT